MRWAALLSLLAFAAAPAGAAGVDPRLGVYVTNENDDVYVAIYGEVALELAVCATADAARAILQLGPEAPAEETTLAALEDAFGLGTHPALPCDGAPFDADWAATAPVWADLEGSGNYFLPAPSGDGFYALPSACDELKRTLAIRERLQLPGVLQGLSAPPDPAPLVLLGCGEDAGGGQPETPQEETAGGFSLHRFATFLTPDSSGDTIYVVRYAPAEGTPAFLPILRVNGTLTSDALLAGGTAAAEVEDTLRALFGIPAAEGVTTLGAEAVTAVRDAVYADLCVSDCFGYPYSSGVFARPGLDLGLTQPVTLAATPALDRTGAGQLRWDYAEGRSLRLTGCTRLVEALGLATTPLGDWMEETGRALEADAAGPVIDCRGAADGTCERRLEAGEPLTEASFALGDCTAGTALRIELPDSVRAPRAITLKAPAFSQIELRPTPGITRTRLVITPTRPASAGTCILTTVETLIAVQDLPRLMLSRIDVLRAGAAGGAEVVALQAERGTVALDRVTIGTGGEDLGTVARGVTLCLADLYADRVRIVADALSLQGVAAKIMIAGRSTERAELTRGRFGLLLSSTSLLRLAFTDIAADTAMVLRGAEVEGASVALSGRSESGSALQLERGSSAHFLTSTAEGFRCAASFLDAASSVSFVLPGNDIAAGNTHTACGPGRFSLIE